VTPPTVTNVSPNSGSTAGGTSVTITGTKLNGATAVMFGATAATGVTVVNATTITATSPANSAGTVDVTVTTGGGTSATSASDHYAYVAPRLSLASVRTPAQAREARSHHHRHQLHRGYRGDVRRRRRNGCDRGQRDHDHRDFASPRDRCGGRDRDDRWCASATSASDQFTYSGPTVTSVSPSSGSGSGGTSVTITGTNFTGATAVNFGGVAATGVTVVSATSITATSRPCDGVVDVTGDHADRHQRDWRLRSVYLSRSDGDHCSAGHGPTAGGTSVTITGTNFTARRRAVWRNQRELVHRQQRDLDHGDLSSAGRGVVDVTVTTPSAPARQARPISSPMRRFRPSQASVRTPVRPRAHQRDDHRHQLHRSDVGGIRRHSGHRRDRGQRHLDHGHNAGQFGRFGERRGNHTGGDWHRDRGYTYVAVPTVTRSADLRTTAGGTTVTITGTNFTARRRWHSAAPRPPPSRLSVQPRSPR